MTNSARGWSVLRRAAGKRLPHPAAAWKRDGLGVQTEALPSAWPFGLNRGQRFAKMAAAEEVNGKCRLERCMIRPSRFGVSRGRSPRQCHLWPDHRAAGQPANGARSYRAPAAGKPRERGLKRNYGHAPCALRTLDVLWRGTYDAGTNVCSDSWMAPHPEVCSVFFRRSWL